MKRASYVATAVLTVNVMVRATPLIAQATRSPAEEKLSIQIQADSLSVTEGGTEIKASGNVEIQRGSTILRAEEVRVNRETTDAEAKGEVYLDDPERAVRASAARLNLDRETGQIDDGEIFFKDHHLVIKGRRFEKLSGQVYRIERGYFTSCLCESGPQHWTIGARELDLREDGTAVVRGGTFYILDIPVFYLPYAAFPARTERKTGFLVPRIGSTSVETFRFQQPFFWAISKSSDATFTLNGEPSARVGVLGEYRTIFRQGTEGQINLSYFDESLRENPENNIANLTIADPEIPRNRWSVVSTHRHAARSGWFTYSDISAFSDDLFLRELVDRFDLSGVQETDLRRSRYAKSNFGFLRSWGDAHMLGAWSFYQDFIQPDAGTFHKTPQLSFWGHRLWRNTPLELRWRAEGVNYLRREGATGLRLDLIPELVTSFQRAPYLDGSLDLALRQTAYHLHSTKEGFDRNTSRELFEIRGNVRTSVGRVFDWKPAGLQKIKHAIEPEVRYLFIPGTSQRDIPIMDAIDRIDRRNLVTFAVTNRLLGKFGVQRASEAAHGVELLQPDLPGDVRELGRLGLALSYNVDRERKDGDTLSDLDLDIQLTPVQYLSITSKLGLDPGPWQLSQAAAGVSISDPRPISRRVLDPDFTRPNSLNLDYRFIRRGPLAELAENANLTALSPERLIKEDVVGGLGWNLFYRLTDHILLSYDSSYDVRNARFPGFRTTFKILSNCECWTLTFSLNRTVNPDKTTFNFRFNLLGLGSSGQNGRIF